MQNNTIAIKLKNWGTGEMTMEKHFYRVLQPESVLKMQCAWEFTEFPTGL